MTKKKKKKKEKKSSPGLDPTEFNTSHIDQRARPLCHRAVLTVNKYFTYKIL